MEAKLFRMFSKADPTAAEKPHLDAIAAAFSTTISRKSEFDDVWETADALESFALGNDKLRPHLPFLLRVQAKKDIFVPNPFMDHLLTALFLGEVAWLFTMFSKEADHDEDPLPVVWTFVVFLAGAAVLVAVAKTLSAALGRCLSRAVVRFDLVDKAPVSGPLQMKKWQEQFWQLVIHTSMTFYAHYLFAHSEAGLYEHMENSWSPKPDEQEHSQLLRWYYMIQLAVWVYTCFIHRFVMERIKDYFMMYLHHIATIALLAGSYQMNYLRIGLLVQYIHDVSDIGVDMLKLVNYLRMADRKGFFASEITFGVNLCTWIYFRLWVYPFYVIRASLFFGYTMGVNPDVPTYDVSWDTVQGILAVNFFTPQLPLWFFCNLLLMLLQVLHVIWTKLFLDILVRIWYEGTHDASRKEYEGDSDDEDIGKED